MVAVGIDVEATTATGFRASGTFRHTTAIRTELALATIVATSPTVVATEVGVDTLSVAVFKALGAATLSIHAAFRTSTSIATVTTVLLVFLSIDTGSFALFQGSAVGAAYASRAKSPVLAGIATFSAVREARLPVDTGTTTKILPLVTLTSATHTELALFTGVGTGPTVLRVAPNIDAGPITVFLPRWADTDFVHTYPSRGTSFLGCTHRRRHRR